MTARANTDSAIQRQERKMSKRQRFKVLDRDGFKCCYCGATPEQSELAVDHIIAIAKGGADHIDNMITACVPCNAGKSDMTMLPANVAAMVELAKTRNASLVAKGKHNSKKAVTIRGVEYDSHMAAAKALGVDPNYIRKAKRKGNLDGVGLRRRGHSKIDQPVTFNGVEYPNFSAASIALKVKISSLMSMHGQGIVDNIGTGGAAQQKAVCIDGVDYPSIRAASVALGVDYRLAWEWSKNGVSSRMTLDHSFLVDGIRYSSIEHFKQVHSCGDQVAKRAKREGVVRKLVKGISVTVRGVTYNSIIECAKAIGVSQSTAMEAYRMGRLDNLGLGKGHNKRTDPMGNQLPSCIFWIRSEEKYRVKIRNGDETIQATCKDLTQAVARLSEMKTGVCS
jgi:hypothetical protein